MDTPGRGAVAEPDTVGVGVVDGVAVRRGVGVCAAARPGAALAAAKSTTASTAAAAKHEA